MLMNFTIYQNNASFVEIKFGNSSKGFLEICNLPFLFVLHFFVITTIGNATYENDNTIFYHWNPGIGNAVYSIYM